MGAPGVGSLTGLSRGSNFRDDLSMTAEEEEAPGLFQATYLTTALQRILQGHPYDKAAVVSEVVNRLRAAGYTVTDGDVHRTDGYVEGIWDRIHTASGIAIDNIILLILLAT